MILTDVPPDAAAPRPEPPPLDERAALARLRALHEAARLEIRVDRRKLSHIDFPLAFEADSNQWAYGIVIAVGLIWWRFGTVPGVSAAVAGYLLYHFVGRHWVARRLERRIHTRGMAEVAVWRKLWQFGGVILVDAATGRTCQGPDGRWMGFIQDIDQGPAE